MGKLKTIVEDWMQDYGYELGYDMDKIPDLKHWSWIQSKNISYNEFINRKK